MAIAFGAASSDFATADGDTTLDVPKPAGLAAGDLLIAACGSVISRSISPPAGWTQIGTTHDDTVRAVALWYKVADSGDAAASTFAFAVSGGFGAPAVALLSLTGATATGLVAAYADAGNNNSAACPNVTPSAANSLVIWGLYQAAQVSPMSADRGTERVDSGPSASAGSFGVYTESPLAASSQTGAVISKNGFGASITFALAVAPSGGGTDSTAPVVSSATVDSAGTTLTVDYTEAGSPPILPSSSVTGYTLKVGGVTRTTSSWARSGTTPGSHTATIGSTVYSSDTVTLDYAPGNVTDSATSPNSLATFSGTSVTNNSTQTTSVVAGTASFVSSGTAGIGVSATAPTGGSGAITYQWERNASGGSYSDLSGATSLTLTDATASAGTLYGYRLKQTRSATTVTTNAVTAQVYTGGSLSSASGPIVVGG